MKYKYEVPPKIGYSIREAAAATSLSRSKLFSLISMQKLRVSRIGGRTIIPADALHALISGEE